MCPDETETHEFKVAITWTGERQGDINLDGRPALVLSSPEAFGGQAGCYTPQELFVSSITACYMTTSLSILRRMKQTIDALTINGAGVIERDPEGGWRFSEIIVKLNIQVADTKTTTKIARVVKLAKKYCMISKAVSCPIHMELEVNGKITPFSEEPP
jgi:peroxiredoxin-like protein